MKKATTKLKIDKIAAAKLPPVAKYAYSPGGVIHGTAKNTGGTKPQLVAR